MAYLLRSMAVIGVIAFNSPVHGSKSDEGAAAETLRQTARIASQLDVKAVAHGAMAAREAAQILAGLDPETRARFIELSLGAAEAKSQAPTR